MSQPEWIEWNGGECPVEPRARIDVRYRDGAEDHDIYASDVMIPRIGKFAPEDWWKHEGEPVTNVIAYRIVEPGK